MKCDDCNNSAVMLEPKLCAEHYIVWFEKTVKYTINEYNLFNKTQKIAVAASGGKDSTSILYILKHEGYDVDAISIDEGIPGYRDKTLIDLEKFCNTYEINLKILSFKNELGSMLMDNIHKINGAPCRACGIMRRHLLNQGSFGYDVIVTGHNIDDEFQSVMMSLFKGNFELALRLGPKSGTRHHDGFTQRVKPLYFFTEKQVLVYSKLKGFDIGYTECPNASLGYRTRVREQMLSLETNLPKLRLNVVNNFLELKKYLSNSEIKTELVHCERCNSMSNSNICAACITKEKVFSN
jgi:tRNA-5-methyluridine54 2-sulfurtransferase